MEAKLGVRWDDESQNPRLIKAKEQNLIDFIEVNYPIAAKENPLEVNLPIYAHSAYNGLCSAYGINEDLAQIIKDEANKYDSPWIGEHLAWLGSQQEGALGYVFNTIYDQEFFDITIKNVERIKQIYQRPVALELGPQYQLTGDIGGVFDDEIDFLIKVAEQTQCGIILDLSHLIISNNNLGRELDYGASRFLEANTIEVHVSGMRSSKNCHFWHDCHDVLPNELTLTLLSKIVKGSQTLKAVTLEHTPDASEEDFFIGIESIKKSMEGAYV